MDDISPRTIQPALAGTSLLVDVHHDVKTKHAGSRDIVLVPAPTADPEDPLNWSPTRKYIFMACLAMTSFTSAFGNSVVYSILIPLAAETHLSLSTLNRGTGYLFLLAGWGQLLWQPLAERFGKRPVYLICLAGCIGTGLWAPFSRGDRQWIGRSILAGLFVAPWEALGAVSINDVFFQHQRGRLMALYATSLGLGNFLSPLLCGFIAEYAGWRYVFWVSVIFNGCALIFCFLFWEESKYTPRLTGLPESDPNVDVTNTTPKTDKEMASHFEASTSADFAAYYPRKTFAQRLSIWNPTPVNVFRRMWDALSYVTWPVVFYVGFAYGSCLIWFNVLNATASLIFTEYYHFKPDIVGVTYVSPGLGYIISAAIVGPLSDYIIVRRARTRDGLAEAEDRLWLFAIPLIFTPGALLLWGVGAAHHVHWFGLVFAMGMLSTTTCVGATVSLTYLVDAYPAIAGEATTASLLVRNTMSFAISYGITPWIEHLGVQNCFISAAFIGMFAAAAFIPMLIWGKKMRQRSQEKYAKKVASRPNVRN